MPNNKRAALALALGIIPAAPALAQAEEAQSVQTLSPEAMFDLADAAITAKDWPGAEAVYRALMQDANPDYRFEARYRLALMYGLAMGDPRRAAVELRALIDAKPDAAPARLALAQMLALMGEDQAAAKEFRQLQAEPLPPKSRRW